MIFLKEWHRISPVIHHVPAVYAKYYDNHSEEKWGNIIGKRKYEHIILAFKELAIKLSLLAPLSADTQ